MMAGERVGHWACLPKGTFLKGLASERILMSYLDNPLLLKGCCIQPDDLIQIFALSYKESFQLFSMSSLRCGLS